MFDSSLLDDLAKRLTTALPNSLRDLETDVQQKFRSILQSTFNKLDLVTREEFDVQVKVLARTRAKLDAMERQVEKLETEVLKNKK